MNFRSKFQLDNLNQAKIKYSSDSEYYIIEVAESLINQGEELPREIYNGLEMIAIRQVI